MGLKFSAVLSIVFHASLAYGQRHGNPAFRWIDLTYALNNDTVMFPGRKLILGTEFEGEKADGSWLASKGFCMSEHTRTHIDAPYHFQKNCNASVFYGIADVTKPYPCRIDFKAAKLLNFPGFDASAAHFLSTERPVNGVGIDTMSLDAGNSHAHPAHKILTKNNVYMLENVANLHLLPCRGFRLFAVPFSVYKGTASPTPLLAKLAVPQILPV